MTFKKKILVPFTLAAVMALNGLAIAANVNLSIRDGQIRDVLNALSTLSGKSIVTDDTVKGTISIDLNDVPFETALDLVTRTKGLSYKNLGNVIVVSSTESMEKNFGSVYTYKLEYANAKEAADTLKSIVKGGTLSYDAATNSLIFTGSAGENAKLKDAVKVIDVDTKQITLESKIIAIDITNEKDLGISWDWNTLYNPDDSSGTEPDNIYYGKIRFGSGYQFRFGPTLNAMITNGKAKILATPRIITVPGKQASIFIGDHIPVLTRSNDNGSVTTSTTFVDAGIKLNFTPVVSESNIISAMVHTEVSTPTLVEAVGNYKITSRTADTNVRMKNGETLVIGGLINEEETKNIEKIPFLSNIPILGELFKNRTTIKRKTEVMMILTPYITDAGASPAIYDNRVKNIALSPVPGSDDEEEQKLLNKEAKRLEKEKAAAAAAKPARKTVTKAADNTVSPYQTSPTRKETMRERAARILAEQKAQESK